MSKNRKWSMTKSNILTAVFIVLAVGFLSRTSHAQYFGQNKVQYEKFDFKVMKTAHFDIYFYEDEREAVEVAARMAERWYKRLSRIFNHDLRSRQPLIMYASHPHFEQTTAISGVLGEGTGGVTEIFKRRIVLPFGGPLADTDHVIGHELVHAFQFDMTSLGSPRGGTAIPMAVQLPLWFIEGLAEYLSIGPVDAHTAMWMRDVIKQKKMPTIKDLENPKYFPYRYGQAVWSYICGRWGDLAVGRIMKGMGRAGDFEQAMERILGVTSKQLSADWHKALEKDYGPLAQTTQLPSESGRQVVKGSEMDRLNVSPVVSPDGKQFVFLSSRDLFSIEMFVSNLQTGKVTHRITKTAVDPHYQSLQFINSAGCWNRDGTQFVFGAISKGKPILSFVNVQNNKVEKEVRFPELGEILNPSWSPDGRFIVFSALTGGFTDLFIYDLQNETTKRLTEDPFADIHPSWSPDGRAIAFVTDRFTTQMSILSTGDYEIALINPDSGEIKKLNNFKKSKNINPQWSPDSKSIFFLSDQNGISNIYRLDLSTGTSHQMTNLYTGVSGITNLSPALSVARDTNQIVYSVYQDGNYSIYSIDSSQALAGEKAVQGQLNDYSAAILPPKERSGSELLGLLKNPLFGLPEETSFPVSPYNSKLTLDYVSPPQLAIGMDRYGTYGAGGAALYWSDMLGYHNLVTMGQVMSRLKDSALLVGYMNSRSRWNWGAVAQRIPYVYGTIAVGQTIMFNEPVYFEQEYLYRQIYYEAGGFASYPFSQARRFEVSAGYQFIDFDQEVVTRAYSLYDNSMILNDTTKLPSAKGLSLGYVSSALVYDTSIFGATSPVIGQSYRLEVSPLIGSIQYYSVLADYRRYTMPVKPFTFAFRFLHYGRYGKGAEDTRLWPMFLGYDGLVRGYYYNSFESREGAEGPDYFDFNRLFGSKMMIANVELRFPLFQVLGIGRGYYGIFPIEFLAFYDVGVAWDTGETLGFSEGEKKPVSSAGVGLRANLFNYIILGFNYVRPLSRPGKGWYFEFSFMPGF